MTMALSTVPGWKADGVGDLDADGFDDAIASVGGGRDGDEYGWVTVLFGGEAGFDPESSIVVYGTEGGGGFGNAVAGAGDVNGDGHAEFIVGAGYTGASSGAAYVYSPACTWYLDADGDGYGDPSTTVTGCREQAGYAPRPDDCDDDDGSVHGAVWYPDEDADGDGATTGGKLACTAPAYSSASWFDCDDRDAARNPDAEDNTADGIDQDCDGHDGAWAQDTVDCDDTGDLADSGREPQDTASVGDSGDGKRDVPDPEPSACGCSAARATPEWAGVVALLLFLGKRRG